MGHFSQELVLLNLPDLMGRVAVLTVGELLAMVPGRRKMNAFGEFLVDSLMANGAGRGEVVEGD